MASDNSLRTQIIAGVISGLIVVVVVAWYGVIAGWFPPIWEWIVAVAKATWAMLLFHVSMPVWLLLLFAVVGFIIAFRVARRPAETKSASSNYDYVPTAFGSQIEGELNYVEIEMVRHLARADGEWLSFNKLVPLLGVPNTRSTHFTHGTSSLITTINWKGHCFD